jgi:hypothetical protein
MPESDRTRLSTTLRKDDRSAVTGEPEPISGHADPRFPDVSWIGHAQEGGGHVPDDFEWPTNPKQRQDDLMGEWPEHR